MEERTCRRRLGLGWCTDYSSWQTGLLTIVRHVKREMNGLVCFLQWTGERLLQIQMSKLKSTVCDEEGNVCIDHGFVCCFMSLHLDSCHDRSGTHRIILSIGRFI
jgi:hypothetical protein